MRKLLCVVVLFISLIFSCFAQSADSLSPSAPQLFDTVYLPPDTLIETETKIVYVDEEYTMDLLIGVYYSTSHTSWDADHEPYAGVSSISNGLGCSFKSQFDRYYIKTGIGIDFQSRSFTHHWTDSIAGTDYFTVLDTFDIVKSIIGNDTVTQYAVMELLDSSEVYSSVDSSARHINRYTCISVPVSVGYSYMHKDFVFNFGVGCAAHFLIGTGQNKSLLNGKIVPESDFLNPLYFSGFAELGADYYFSEYFAVSLSALYSRSLPSIYSVGNASLKRQSLGGSVSFQFIF